MAINNFKPFATAANANVMAQADWEALPALLSGFMAGKASSAQVNKAIRQASFIAAALAQYTANKSGQDVLDNGDLNGFITKMSAAFGKDFQALDATLTALAGLATGANKLPYFTGTDTASQTDLTSVGRDIIGKSTIADILTYLHLEETVRLAAGALQINMDGKDIRDPATFRKSLNLGDSATRNTGSGLAEVVTGSILNFVIASLELKSASRAEVGTGDSNVPNNTIVASAISAALTAFLPKREFTTSDYIRIPDEPGGLIIQWGRSAVQIPANSSGNITLPTAFPNGGLFAVAFYSGDSGLQSTFNALVGSGSVKVFNTHPTNAATPSVLAFGR
ncbi:hypothetical protein LJU39_15900 [Citrobacter freundii]|uniref:gp53-like domain-containing protein n=2 Tax=Enterobacteriaceae TaxID=543 RepID=UPI001F4C1D5E|nr:hypothetical protein [Citrobacter cronae]UDV51684.1 hypothetical protein LJU39_15900 [Citrobacter freundii]